MKVLVIGARGVIGSAASEFFKQRGDIVIDWDIEISPDHDLRVQGALELTLKEETPDIALFFAFDVGGSKYSIESAEYVSNNMRIIQNTLEALGKYKIPFIHTTSQMSNMDHNPYGPLKRVAEFYTKYLGGVNVKVWNVYGPENVGPKSHAIADFIEQAKTLKRIQMLSDGQEVRQFLHAQDFARALSIIVDHYTEFSGKTVDVSSFKWTSIREVANVVAKVCGPDVVVLPGHVASGFQTKVNKPSEDFLNTGWKPCISLEDGIKSCLK
jgi:nucleoside-diphosphate-sugar epimerase